MTTTITEALGRLEAHVQRIREGLERVTPGMPLAFTTACTAGDRIAQGDLNLTITTRGIPADYVKQSPTGKTFQLVPGNTMGSKHTLAAGWEQVCDVYLPPNWSGESLLGPMIVTKGETKVDHPKHGDVTIPAGLTCDCTYQRAWDAEQRRERRAED